MKTKENNRDTGKQRKEQRHKNNGNNRDRGIQQKTIGTEENKPKNRDIKKQAKTIETEENMGKQQGQRKTSYNYRDRGKQGKTIGLGKTRETIVREENKGKLQKTKRTEENKRKQIGTQVTRENYRDKGKLWKQQKQRKISEKQGQRKTKHNKLSGTMFCEYNKRDIKERKQFFKNMIPSRERNYNDSKLVSSI